DLAGRLALLLRQVRGLLGELRPRAAGGEIQRGGLGEGGLLQLGDALVAGHVAAGAVLVAVVLVVLGIVETAGAEDDGPRRRREDVALDEAEQQIGGDTAEERGEDPGDRDLADL